MQTQQHIIFNIYYLLYFKFKNYIKMNLIKFVANFNYTIKGFGLIVQEKERKT